MSIPSFESAAVAIVESFAHLDEAASRHADTERAAVQTYLDACRAAGVPADQANVTALGDEIRGSQAFIDAIAEGVLEAKTVTEYAQSAMRAYFHNVPFTKRLKNVAEMALPWSKKKASAAPAKKAKSAAPAADLPEAPDMVPHDEADGRAYVLAQAKALTAWANANMKTLDLQTREVVEHFARAAAYLAKK